MIVADDGITNYKDAQYAIDNDLPMIVVNHAGCEIGGLKNMMNYFNDKDTFNKLGYKAKINTHTTSYIN